MSNIGRIIQDIYCNGYADNQFDMHGAVVIAEGDSFIVCKKQNGVNVFISFQTYDWNRQANGELSGGISNLRTQSDMQELIGKWCE